MEKTVSFSVFKEKIIKTNELLQLHLEKTKELEKTKKRYQQLINKLELSGNEINKFKLRDENLSYNLKISEKKYATLQVEHDQLKVQFENLDKEFNEKINSLQIKYQQANQELEECKAKLSKFEEDPVAVVKPKSPPKRKPKSSTKGKKIEASIENSVINCKIRELTAKKEEVICENSDLKLEIYKLKLQLNDLNHLKDAATRLEELETKLSEKQEEILNLQNCLKNVQASKNEEVDRLTKELNSVNIEKTRLENENEKLLNENCSYRVEMSVLQENDHTEEINKLVEDNRLLKEEITNLKTIIIKYEHSNLAPQNENCDNNSLGDQQVKEIMKELSFPPLLSPFSNTSEETIPYQGVAHTLPLVSENTSLQEGMEPYDTPLPDVSQSDYSFSKTKNIRSSSGKFSVCTYPEVMKISKRKSIRKKKKKGIKKKSKNVDLYETLLALKKANISFVISSDSLLPERANPIVLSPPQTKNTDLKVAPERKYLNKNVTNKLECTLDCCKDCHVLLKGGDDENAPLLGFFDVKTEKPKTPIRIESFDKVRWPKMMPLHRSKRRRKKAYSVVEKNCQNENLTENVITSLELENTFETNNNNNALSKDNQSPDRKKRKRNTSNTVAAKERVVCHSYVTRNAERTRKISLESDSSVSAVTKRFADASKAVSHTESNNNEVKKIAVVKPKSPKTTFKRPVCSTRRSLRLLSANNKPAEDSIESGAQETSQNPILPTVGDNKTEKSSERVREMSQNVEPPSCPRSPTPENQTLVVMSKPKVIPLEKVSENVKRMPPSKIEVLFVKLINYSVEEETLNEVVREFAEQDPEYIAQAILEKVCRDYHDSPDSKYSPAPLMTETQRTMLGFMSKLEKTNVTGVFDSFLTLAEHRLLTCPLLQEIAPVTRLYLAICKLRKDLHRMRKLCCDVFYFCGDLAVPFLFYVLTSWTEVLPHEAASKDMPLAKVLVQIVYMKDCNKPGYNLMPLRDLLIKFYGYPTERWDSSELFQELYHAYLRNPVRSSDFALLLFCKNHPEKWVYDKIEEHLKPIVDKIPAENFKAAVIILIGNLYHRFSPKSDYLPNIREWLTSLITESTPDVVKRSVYLCLNRLAKK